MKNKKSACFNDSAEINVTGYLKEDDYVIGCFLINKMRGLPNLQHFFISKDYRNLNNVRNLIMRTFVPAVKDLGFKQAYLHARTPRQAKLIKYFFKKDPYAIENNIAWFLVDI